MSYGTTIKCNNCGFHKKVNIPVDFTANKITCPKCKSYNIVVTEPISTVSKQIHNKHSKMNRKAFRDYLELTFKKCLTIVDSKNADYANNDDPFQNFRAAEQNGIMPTEVGMLIRMQDKWARIINLIKRGGKSHVKDESLDDTILDCDRRIVVRGYPATMVTCNVFCDCAIG